MNFDNSYTRLPARFYRRQLPEPVSAPQLIGANSELALQLGIDPEWLCSPQGVATIAGNRMPPGADPVATVYAGHQFGVWNPQLGDGRALLLGELIGERGGRFDLQLKGSGRTPYSRGGDGRSPLGPVLREYLLCEGMHALGIPTTRALAAVTSGDQVQRETPLPGAVLARVAESHVRIGTLQFFAARKDVEALSLLVDHVLNRHFASDAGDDSPALQLLERVIAAQAELLARWQLAGFIHGVMNTDNMLLNGLTIDYGPCAFMDHYDPAAVFSSIDREGRYAFQNQPGIAHWNLVRLAEALLPLLGDERSQAVAVAEHALNRFPGLYQHCYRDGMARKLGLSDSDSEDDALAEDLLARMARAGLDYTLTFRRLALLADPAAIDGDPGVPDFPLSDSLDEWLTRWRARLRRDPLDAAARQRSMYAANPVFIPRNHRVEEAISAAVSEGDFAPFQRLLERLKKPFDYAQRDARYALPPATDEVVRQTFCGT